MTGFFIVIPCLGKEDCKRSDHSGLIEKTVIPRYFCGCGYQPKPLFSP
jgi:hypothetical protein